MNKNILFLLSFTLLASCSNSFSDANLRKATSRATGLAEYEFIIGNRDNGVSTINYDIKTTKGDIYHCSTVFAPLQGGITTSPTCEDKFGSKLVVTDKTVRF